MSFIDLQKTIINKNLCSRCGTCAGICPTRTIHFPEPTGDCLPADLGKCSPSCTLCTQVCPGGKSMITEEELGLGRFADIKLLRATEPEVLQASTSGGGISALLRAFLTEKLIDGVLLVGAHSERPAETVARFVTTPEEIQQNIQSRYCVVPVNELIHSLEKGKKYAIVALPCMLEGLKNWFKIKPSLEAQIVLKLGLFCHSTMLYSATEDLLKQLNLNPNQLSSIRYRQGRFPGGFIANYETDPSATIPLEDFMGLFNLHMPNRCRLCVDHFGTYADLAFADPFSFLDELPADDPKWTATVIRTPVGLQFMEKLNHPETFFDVRDGSAKNIHDWDQKLKTIQNVHRNQISLNKKIHLPAPEFELKLHHVSYRQALFNLIRVHIFKDIMMNSKEILRRLLSGQIKTPPIKKQPK